MNDLCPNCYVLLGDLEAAAVGLREALDLVVQYEADNKELQEGVDAIQAQVDELSKCLNTAIDTKFPDNWSESWRRGGFH